MVTNIKAEVKQSRHQDQEGCDRQTDRQKIELLQLSHACNNREYLNKHMYCFLCSIMRY